MFTVRNALFTLVTGGNDCRRGFLNGRTELEWHELLFIFWESPSTRYFYTHAHPLADQRRVERALFLALSRSAVCFAFAGRTADSLGTADTFAFASLSALSVSLANSPRIFACFFLHL